MALDLVCGKVVNEEETPHASQYQGMSFYFCSAE
ncbi:MAG: YHS domain-containing protein, partial [Anaerolineae bacterium]|nr:YHS domain-containing protein [Anaerolineae bacterium]